MTAADGKGKKKRRNVRASVSMGEVLTKTPDDASAVVNDPSKMQPIRILVTLHHMEAYGKNMYEKGLGYWVYYVFHKYLKKRNIPYTMSLKSIVVSGPGTTTIKDITGYIKKNKVDILIPTDTTDTMFLAKHIKEIKETGVHIALTPDLDIYEMLEDKWRTYNFAIDNGICKWLVST